MSAPPRSWLHAAINKVLATPELKQSYATLSTEVEPVAPDELGKRMQRDQARWVDLIRAVGIEPQ